jgi:carboxylate-amine ligase
MGIYEPSFTIGVEEEYLLVDKETRSLVIDPPETLMAEAEEKCGAQVTSELLKSQIEIGTKVCTNIQEAQEDLARLRKNIIDVAANHGIAPIAASTHPFSKWVDQKHTEKDRYDQLPQGASLSAECTCMWVSRIMSCGSTL